MEEKKCGFQDEAAKRDHAPSVRAGMTDETKFLLRVMSDCLSGISFLDLFFDARIKTLNEALIGVLGVFGNFFISAIGNPLQPPRILEACDDFLDIAEVFGKRDIVPPGFEDSRVIPLKENHGGAQAGGLKTPR